MKILLFSVVSFISFTSAAQAAWTEQNQACLDGARKQYRSCMLSDVNGE